MAPEQAAGDWDRVDTRSDVYSLGAILYLLLTGQPPHGVSGPTHEMIRRIINGRIVRPRQLKPKLETELEAVLLTAMASDPDRRYASVEKLAGDARRYLNGEPLTARPPTLLYVSRKWLRRRWAPVTAVASTLCVLLVLAFFSYWSIRNQRDEMQSLSHQATLERQVALQQRHIAELNLARALHYEGDELMASNRAHEALARYQRAQALGRSQPGSEGLNDPERLFTRSNWIWSRTRGARGDVHCFRYTAQVSDDEFMIAGISRYGTGFRGMNIAASGPFTVFLNGHEVAHDPPSSKPLIVRRIALGHFKPGKNVLAIEVRNPDGESPIDHVGLLVRLFDSRLLEDADQYSDSSWKASENAVAGWEAPGFDDTTWLPAATAPGYSRDLWGKLRLSDQGTQSPFGASPAPIPGILQAAAFDEGGEGVGYHKWSLRGGGTAFGSRNSAVDLDYCAEPGVDLNVGGILPGEWLSYTIDVQTDGVYDIQLRTASPSGGALHLEFTGVAGIVAFALPGTTAWQQYATTTVRRIPLRRGRQALRIVFDRNNGDDFCVCNLAWIRFYPTSPAREDSTSGPLQARQLVNDGLGSTPITQWKATFFSWDMSSNPRANLDAWRKRATDSAAVSVRLPELSFRYGNLGPSDMHLSKELDSAQLDSGHFGMIATTTVNLPAGPWRFKIVGTSGVRLLIDNNTLVEDWSGGASGGLATLAVPSSRIVQITVEHFQSSEGPYLIFEMWPAKIAANRSQESDQQ